MGSALFAILLFYVERQQKIDLKLDCILKTLKQFQPLCTIRKVYNAVPPTHISILSINIQKSKSNQPKLDGSRG